MRFCLFEKMLHTMHAAGNALLLQCFFDGSDGGYVYSAALLSDIFSSVSMFSHFTAFSTFPCVQRHVRT